MTEGELLQAVRDLARYRKWLTYHTYRSTRSEAGFPDLVLLRVERLLFVELKSQRGKLTYEQQHWRVALQLLHRPVEYHLWTPKQWNDGTIDDVLR